MARAKRSESFLRHLLSWRKNRGKVELVIPICQNCISASRPEPEHFDVNAKHMEFIVHRAFNEAALDRSLGPLKIVVPRYAQTDWTSSEAS